MTNIWQTNLCCSEDFAAFVVEKQLLGIINNKFFLKYVTFFVEFLLPVAWSVAIVDEKHTRKKWPVFAFFSHEQIRQKRAEGLAIFWKSGRILQIYAGLHANNCWICFVSDR